MKSFLSSTKRNSLLGDDEEVFCWNESSDQGDQVEEITHQIENVPHVTKMIFPIVRTSTRRPTMFSHFVDSFENETPDEIMKTDLRPRDRIFKWIILDQNDVTEQTQKNQMENLPRRMTIEFSFAKNREELTKL